MKRVVVTGIGSITPLGNSFGQSWDALKAGRSGIGRITRFDASHLQWKCAGELKDFEREAYLAPKEIKRLDPFVHYAVAASFMAAEDAGLIDSNKLRVTSNESKNKNVSNNLSLVTCHSSLNSGGVIIGSSRGGISTLERELLRLYGSRITGPGSRCSPYLMPSTTVGMAASQAAKRLGVKGNCLGVSNACASGANAIGEAFRLIKSGYSSLVIAGGSEAPICRICVEGYGTSGALAMQTIEFEKEREVSRPFDEKRKGFVLSEGACVLVLEDYEGAMERGARIYGEIIGYGNTSDAFDMTKPDRDGESRAILSAMKDAAINPDDVDYINTHGTGTQIGDRIEAEAIWMAFKQRASKVPASAIKSMTGHMLAASGAFEIASTLMTMREGVIPPTINLEEKDPECDINIVTERREAYIRIALSNSFGFGGVNAVVILKRIE